MLLFSLRSITPMSSKSLYQDFTKQQAKSKGQEATNRRNLLP